MVAIGLVWAFNVLGVRPAVWFGYVTGGALLLPAFVLMFLPYVTGDWSSDNMTWEIGAGGGLALALTWLYFMGWSSYGFETVAAFAPEYENPEFDTPRALRAAAAFSVVVYALLPLGIGGTLGTATIAEDATFISFYTQAFDILVGDFLGTVMVLCLIAGLLLSMNTATMDGSRALYGISKDGMTIKELGVLSGNNVPARAMTVDAVLNLFLLTYFAGAIEIIAAGNLGYMLSHVFALTGFLLLRRDRPAWPRPIKLSADLAADRRAARRREPALHRGGRIHLCGRVRLRLGQDLGGRDRARGLAPVLDVPPPGAGQDGSPATRGGTPDAHGGGRGPHRHRLDDVAPEVYSGLSFQRGRSAIARR